jgi:riboflavin synthase
MFTGIVQGLASVQALSDQPGLRRITLHLPRGFKRGLRIGASVSVDGVCLTVSRLERSDAATFDVMQQTLRLTTIGKLVRGDRVNVERAARDGAEVGGHPLSGHIDFQATVSDVRTPQNNHVLRFGAPAPWMRYLFAKGFVAINGASLTLADVHRAQNGSGWFEVWLIPETLRMTTFSRKKVGSAVNVEVDRQTQVFVDTITDAIRGVAASIVGGFLPKGESTTMAKKRKKTGTLAPRDDNGTGPLVKRKKSVSKKKKKAAKKKK